MTKEELFEKMRETHKKMLLTKRETAQELSVSEATIDRMRTAGDIQCKRVLGQVMFPIDEIASFLADE